MLNDNERNQCYYQVILWRFCFVWKINYAWL